MSAQLRKLFQAFKGDFYSHTMSLYLFMLSLLRVTKLQCGQALLFKMALIHIHTKCTIDNNDIDIIYIYKQSCYI